MRFVVTDSKLNDAVRGANGRVRVFGTRKAADAVQDQLNHRRRTRRYRVELEPLSEKALRDNSATTSRSFAKTAKANPVKGVKPMR